MNINDTVQLNITNLSGEGEGIARLDGMVVFVRGAVSGETVKARITEIKKTFARAEVLDILEPSALRIEASCPEFAHCGGCSLQILSYEDQLTFKQNYVSEVLRRIGNVPVNVLKINAFSPYAYRNRVQWHCRDGKLGFYDQKSHSLTLCGNCLLLPDIFNRILLFLNEQKLPASLWHLTLQANNDSSKLMAVFCADAKAGKSERKLYENLSKLLCSAIPEMHSVFMTLTEKKSLFYGREFIHLAGEKHLPVELCGKSFLLYPSAFLQVNYAGCEALYAKAAEWAALCGAKRIWDIYCGIGTITLLLADNAAEITGIELNAPAIAAAKANAHLNGNSNTRFLCGRAEDILPEEVRNGKRADLAVLDPPRAGCARAVIDALLAAAPKHIIYISCDPATLARDLKLLQESYELQQIECFDLFPQTVHCETAALLRRRNDDDHVESL